MPGRAVVALLALVALGPTAWGLHLTVSYWLVPVACRAGSDVGLHVATAVAALAAVGALAWGYRRLARRGDVAGAVLGRRAETGGGGAEGARQLFDVMGFALAGFFLLIVLVAGLSPLMLGACE